MGITSEDLQFRHDYLPNKDLLNLAGVAGLEPAHARIKTLLPLGDTPKLLTDLIFYPLI